ncbi:MAG: hypothetical protein AUJ96_27560 [Armatimonadetes bacterium CG2_30_66_41]|nr:Gfo/Idh/MocA family oxidoreductase [Armatimonadota bacterium]OIO95074.1 MAG: hypothetical protein AUJ96_27560 [Armatimonadetes bacterium CG2_30_66_41]
MPNVNLGLIGFGEWARGAYVPTLSTLDNVEVVAVAARSAATRQRAREMLGEAVATTADYREVLADASVDAVLVAVPNALHREVAVAALAQGKHLFLELPIALVRGDVRAVLDAATSADRLVQFDFELRYLPVAQAVQRLVARGDVGRPLSASVDLSCNWGRGGGDFSDPLAREAFYLWVGAWYLDMLDVLLGGLAPRGAQVTGIRAFNGPMLDQGHALLEYDSGAVGRFSHSILSPKVGTFVTGWLLGEEGELVVDFQEGTLTKYSAAGSVNEGQHPPKRPVHGWAGMRESLESFVSAVGEGTPVVADAEVARRVHEAAFACHEADQRARGERE